MKKLQKITVHNAEDVLNREEMKNIIGGYEGQAKSCADHNSTEECFGPCTIIANETLVEGECKWLIFTGLKYAGCGCVAG